MTRIRPASSCAKMQSGCVGQASVLPRPLIRIARTVNLPAPSSKPGRRCSSRVYFSHPSTVRKAASDEANSAVTSALSTPIDSGVVEPAAQQFVAQLEQVHLADALRRARGSAPSSPSARP